MSILNSNSFLVLSAVRNKQDDLGLCEARGMTKDMIAKKINLSSSTVNRALNALMEYELIAEGVKLVNTKTYYILPKGVERLKEIYSKKGDVK